MRKALTIRNEREYDLAVKRLNGLLDEIGTNERHPLYGLLDTLGTLIHAYEEKLEMPEPSGPEMLRFFMGRTRTETIRSAGTGFATGGGGANLGFFAEVGLTYPESESCSWYP